MKNHNSIRLHDTASNNLVDVDCSGREVGIYTCGPTVYKDAHIGNMRAYMTADLLRRSVALQGGDVKQVINITDVGHLTSDADTGDDKVEKSATEKGVTAWDIAEEYEAKFWEDFDALGMQRPEVVAHATAHIEEQIDLIRQLETGGYTYMTGDGVYFDSSKYDRYADFAKLDLKGQSAGERVEMGSKRNPSDFALWKFPLGSGKRDMQWDSPWGEGFPGWHIECSAMAIKYLGSQFDIHTGGVDHIPVHHTNEIAQARAAGHEFADYWVHTAFLLDDNGEKMSKSSGASSRVPDVLRDYNISLGAMRYLYLSHHYQSPLEFGASKVDQASAAHTRLLDVAAISRQTARSQSNEATVTADNPVAKQLWDKFQSSIALDNLNSPVALDTLHQVVKAKALSPVDKDALIEKMDLVLDVGIVRSLGATATTPEVTDLLARRGAARSAKDFAASDNIRDQLLAVHGLRVIDSPAGQVTRGI